MHASKWTTACISAGSNPILDRFPLDVTLAAFESGLHRVGNSSQVAIEILTAARLQNALGFREMRPKPPFAALRDFPRNQATQVNEPVWLKFPVKVLIE